MMGQVSEVSVKEHVLHQKKLAQVWFKVEFSIEDKITLIREVGIMRTGASMEFEFAYGGLEKLCSTCGSLQHSYEVCPRASALSSSEAAFMDIAIGSNNPYVTASEILQAIEGFNKGKDIGESRTPARSISTALVSVNSAPVEVKHQDPAESSLAIVDQGDPADSSIVDASHGTKRKAPDTFSDDDPSPNKKQTAKPSIYTKFVSN
ncbi:unnamed protein product [Arabis nemorensis]|uniref:Zinc knuckle CX2CX4HX4C domain-containing protein n=1 Tax=Arabis nemorensis TaxID=586526 RepID=A0A565BEE0_9BRAS|nr:unnamed protein product [Arabis nemorensis]